MKVIADLHLHGKYSRATSKELSIPNLEKYGRMKGVTLLGTGDYTHPQWITHLKKELVTENQGILYTKNGFAFLLSTEISLIYSQGGKGRRIHNIVLAPSFAVVDQITDWLKTKGRLDYDGRPIFNMPCPEFVEGLMKISKEIEVIPAHIWTPWFSLFGSKSGFDTVEECFKDQTKYIHAMETGLSSDPAMNWRLSQLDSYTMVSFSDAHSFWPWRLGREATVFGFDKLTYNNIVSGLRTKKGLKMTVEVEPAYGKYHADGHRNCDVCMTPVQTKRAKGICPKCKKPLTIGVWTRVEELADRAQGYKPKDAIPFLSLLPLSEIIAHVLGKGIATKNVWAEYSNLVTATRSEYEILLETSLEELKKLTTEKIAEAIIKNRKGKIEVKPGYDGEYGVPLIEPQKEKVKQTSLGQFS